MDSYPGWTATLNFVHRVTGWDAHSLVLFSFISLFLLFCIIPLIFLKRPEAWLISLASLALVDPGMPFRLMLGRPFIVTMTALSIILFTWPSLNDKKRRTTFSFFLILLAAITFWMHSSWYFFAMFTVVLIISREWRAALIFGACSAAGIFAGAALTGHPVIFLKQEILHTFFVFSSSDASRFLVGELQPSLPNINVAMLVLFILGWRVLRGKWDREAIDNPAFILLCLSFILGIVSRRVWIDWGLPAVAVWMAGEFDEFLSRRVGALEFRRIGLALISGVVFFIIVTTDVGGRWSLARPVDYISAEDPEQRPWLPDRGGIVYSANMDVFYQTFFKNPHGDWRYILGFESAFMPREDLDIYRDIQRNNGNYKYYYPWVKKMRPEDRLIIRGSPDAKPRIPELEWYYAAHATWSGRLPRKTP